MNFKKIKKVLFLVMFLFLFIINVEAKDVVCSYSGTAKGTNENVTLSVKFKDEYESYNNLDNGYGGKYLKISIDKNNPFTVRDNNNNTGSIYVTM